jgi:DNA gyrase inhibitor GyrI
MSSKQNLKCEWEEIVMSNNPILSGALRIISLPAMRVAVCNVISESPEDEALGNVLEWAGEENLMGTARIFGFNTTPYSPESAEYGWAACITIPEQVKIPEYLEEKRLPGGLYASFNSTNEVYDSWQTLMRLLKECEEYEVDKNRPCLEEHILSGELKEQGNDFYLTLLEPVRKLAL